jgi:hypothetical protein
MNRIAVTGAIAIEVITDVTMSVEVEIREGIDILIEGNGMMSAANQSEMPDVATTIIVGTNGIQCRASDEAKV